jgi:histidyl-tRNA synthetase
MGPGARTVAEVFVTLFDTERAGAALQLARELRAAGLKVETALDASEKLGKQFKHADRRGIPFALVLGPDELARGEVVVKNLRNGEQHSIARATVAAALRGVDVQS